MIELPDGKISRTLPEQVGFLSEQVHRIFRFLDGINVQDNVVVVDNIATPLTAEELVIVNRDVAFLVYSGQLYIKKSVSGPTAYFDVVFSISGSTTITFNSSEIQVNLTNGGMSLVTNSLATYATSQIDLKADKTYVDAQLALKANLSGANFTGAVTAPTLEQANPNFSAPFTTSNGPTGITITDVYNRFEQIGNVLYIIVNVKVANDTAATVTFNKLGETASSVVVPQAVSEKLIDIEGHDGTYNPSPRALLAIDDMLFIKGTNMNSTSGASVKRGTIGINHVGSNAFGVFMYFNETVSLEPAESGLCSCRMPLTLL